MSLPQVGASRADLIRLFDGGSTAGLGDGELLGRFVARRDEAAFEALVTRLGPMVLGVCRRILADPRDVEDAFQATFLVLVRRAGSIGDRDLLGPWLHGVALKVARRARFAAIRRASRERLGQVVAEPEAIELEPWAERSELRARIDEEIGRLPESHRRLVVLCDVEGLSREEAAARLGWTTNMVRGRLERARGRLRDRLTRRGLAPSGAGAMLAMPALAPRAALVGATVRGAMSLVVGGAAEMSAAVILSGGVARMMMLAKWKLAATALFSAGALVAGTGVLSARQGPGDGPPAAKAPAIPPPGGQVVATPLPPPPGADAVADALKPRSAAELNRARLEGVPEESRAVADALKPRSAAELNRARMEAAKDRYVTQAAFYEEGRITIDRLVNAARALMEAERDSATTKAGRIAAVRSHYARLDMILKREQAELEVGRATSADVADPQAAILEAELLLAREIEAPERKRPEPPPAVAPPADREARREPSGRAAEAAKGWVEAAKARYEAQSGFLREGRINIGRVLDASQQWMNAESAANDSKSARFAAVQGHIARLRSILASDQAKAGPGELAGADVAEVQQSLEAAQAVLAGLPVTFAVTRKKLLDAARDRLESQREFYKEGRITVDRLADASRQVMEAERELFDDPITRTEAIRSHIARLEQIRDGRRPGEGSDADLAEFRTHLAAAAYLLASEGGGSASDTSGVVPSPGGPLPATRPARTPPAEDAPIRTLKEAIAAFQLASHYEVGPSEPPLTEDEVVAAIRIWQPNREATRVLNGLRTNLTPGTAPIAAFRAIAESRQMPPGARFRLETSRDVGDDQLYAGRWITLVVPGGGDASESARTSHGFPIRERLIRVIPLEEVLEQEKADRRVHAGLVLPKDLPLADRIKNLEGRIRWRDGKPGVK